MRLAQLTAVLGLGVALGLGGCVGNRATVRLITSPVIANSGILIKALHDFEGRTGHTVAVIPAPSALALAMAAKGDADLALIDSPTDVQAFLARGFGTTAEPLLRTQYVLVGPPTDPAGVRRQETLAGALHTIAQSRQPFVSQATRSGVHRLERDLWLGAGIMPRGPWYRPAAVDSPELLQLAEEAQAYTLCELNVFENLKAKGRITLKWMRHQDPQLAATAVLIPVRAAGEATPSGSARALLRYLRSPEAHTLIAQTRFAPGLAPWSDARSTPAPLP